VQLGLLHRIEAFDRNGPQGVSILNQLFIVNTHRGERCVLDNFYGSNSAVDGCPGYGFWTRRGASSACPGHHFGRDELCLSPPIVELKIFELKIFERKAVELKTAELMTAELMTHSASGLTRKFYHRPLSGTLERFSRAVNSFFGSHNTQ